MPVMVPARLLRGARAGQQIAMTQVALDAAIEAGWAEAVSLKPGEAKRDDNPEPEKYLEDPVGYSDREMTAARSKKREMKAAEPAKVEPDPVKAEVVKAEPVKGEAPPKPAPTKAPAKAPTPAKASTKVPVKTKAGTTRRK